MNWIVINGRLAQDAERRITRDGREVLIFNVACNRRIAGEERTDFITVVAYDVLHDLHKGDSVVVEGTLHVTRRNGNIYGDVYAKRVYTNMRLAFDF